ncbi:MAG: 7,8-didemethyl-8-hydroxy-5-deazariboflavin synthase subunit CofG [Verrucomicrobia bacterium]|nr:MAG: 7,8-didemethyl-8-hydroxy-5-deazariboflavin synthase subunit CofG [Verrucomicrobiota bacterium]
MPRTVTHSPTLTVPLTTDCPWHCNYCGYRTDQKGLIADASFHHLLDQAQAQDVSEILFLSGEAPDTVPHLRSELRRRGFPDFVAYARWACERVLERGFLPHANLGALARPQIDRLKGVTAAMSLMLENVDDAFNRTVAPEKTAASRLAAIEAAGAARVPFTSGILVGLGESRESRLRSLDALAASHARHGHLMGVLLNNFVPNAGSTLHAAPETPGVADYLELIEHCRRVMPGVGIQIPPHLNPHWQELLPLVDDLGSIGAGDDLANSSHPWASPGICAEACAVHGLDLGKRLPVWGAHAEPGWVSDRVRRAIEDRG